MKLGTKCFIKSFVIFFIFIITVYAGNTVIAKNSFPRPEEFGLSVELQVDNTELTVDQEVVLTGIVKNISNKSLSMRITIYSDQPSFKVIEMNPEWAEEKTLNPFEEMHVMVRLGFEKAGRCEVGLMIIMPDKPAMSEPIVFNVKEKPVSLMDILWKIIPIIIVASMLISIVCIKRIRTALNTMASACYLKISAHKDETMGHFTIFILTLLTLLLPMLPEEFVLRIFSAYLTLLFIGIPVLAFLDGVLYKRTWASFTVMFASFMLAGLIITSNLYSPLRAFLVYLYFGFIAGVMGLSSSLVMLKKKPINVLGIVVLIISLLLWTLLIFPSFQNIYLAG